MPDADHRAFVAANDLRRDALVAIARIEAADETPIGLAVKDRLEQYHRATVNHGALYPALRDLEADGLVTVSEVDGRSNAYELTPAGRRALRRHAQWLAGGLEGEL